MLNRDRVIHWLSVGAQPTDTVRSLLKNEGIMLEMYLTSKGAPMDEVAGAVESHLTNKRNRRAAGRKTAKPAAEAPAEVAAEAPAAEAPAAEAPASEPVVEPAAE
jgi:small subunit ribosomal protein S16